MCDREPINCIIPPHILKNIAEKGIPSQSEKALMTLVSTEQLRGRRVGLSSMSTLFPSVDTGVKGKNRVVYSAKNGLSLPGVVVRRENEPPIADEAANEAFDGSGDTYDLFHDIYARHSIDDRGFSLDSTIHYQVSYDNAFWDGAQMVYGDGDEDLPEADRIFNRFTVSLDVIGHELTHGLIQNECKLIYWDQAGALNESFADVFGILVKQYKLKESVVESDWTIGSDIFTKNVKAIGLRSMIQPGTAYDDPIIGKDPQPAHMNEYVITSADNAGVHINSSIPNRAFCLTAIEIGGYAWEKAGMIWYSALTKTITENSNFQDAANKTYEAAANLFGVGSLEQIAVKKGWAQVGIEVRTDVTNQTPKPGQPLGNGCLPGLFNSVIRVKNFGKG